MADEMGTISFGIDAELRLDKLKSQATQLRALMQKALDSSAGKELDSRMLSLQAKMDAILIKSQRVGEAIEQTEDALSTATQRREAIIQRQEEINAQIDEYNAKIAEAKDIKERPEVGPERWRQANDAIEEYNRKINSLIYESNRLGKDFAAADAEVNKLDGQLGKLEDTQEQLNNQARVYTTQWEEITGTPIDGDSGQMGMWAKTVKFMGDCIVNFPRDMLHATVRGLKELFSPKAWKDAISAKITKIKKRLEGLGKAVKSVGAHIKTFAGHLKNKLGKGMDSADKSFKKGFRNLLKYGLGVRSFFVLFRKLRAVLSEGFKEMAKMNGGSNAVNKAMSNLTSSLTYLKNAFVSAFAPILTVVEPILTSLLDTLAEVMNKIGMFVAMLSGATTFQKAVRQQKDYAKSLDGVGSSADKAKQKLAEYDKLEVISQDSGGGGSTGNWEEVPVEETITDMNSMFDMILGKLQELADMAEGVGGTIGEALKKGLESIPWDFIQKAVNLVAEGIGNLINGFTGVEGLGDTIGNTFAQILNTITGFWSTLLKTIKFDQVGSFLGDIIMGFFGNIDTQQFADMYSGIINAVSNFLLGLSEAIDGFTIATTITDILNKFLEGIDWDTMSAAVEGIVEDLVGFINGFIQTADFGAIGESLSNLLKLGLDFCIGLLEGIDWGAVGEAILEFLSSIDWLGLAARVAILLLNLITGALEIVRTLIGGALDQLVEMFKYLGLNGIAGFFEGISEKLKAATTWLKDVLTTYIINPIKNFFGIHSPSTVFAGFGNMLMQGLINGIAEKIGAVIEKFTLLKTKITDVFKSIAETVLNIVSKLWEGLKKPINAILGGIESLANWVINGLNDMIGALNMLSFDVPDWVPLIGGKQFGLNVPTLSNIALPRLAQGAVIPPNREFAAILGDQRSGTNIETPLDTMVQAFRQALEESGGAHQPIVLQLNGKTVAQAVWDEEKKKYKQTGSIVYS